MDYTVTQIENPIVITGIQKKTTNENNQAMQDIPASWQQFFALAPTIDAKEDTNTICLYSDYEKDFTGAYACTIGYEGTFDHSSPNIITKTIPAGTYARFTVNGPLPDIVQQAWAKIWELPLDRTYIADFEQYHAGSSPENATVEIFLSINQ